MCALPQDDVTTSFVKQAQHCCEQICGLEVPKAELTTLTVATREEDASEGVGCRHQRFKHVCADYRASSRAASDKQMRHT